MIRVTVDDGACSKMFIPYGDEIEYTKVVTEEARPHSPGHAWSRRIKTVHTLSWEVVTHE